MATLYLDSYDEARGGWVVAGELRPGDRPGSLSDNRPHGRDVYVFGLEADGTTATLYRAPYGEDYVYGPVRVVEGLRTPWNRVARLRTGEQEAYEMTIRSDVGGRMQRVRFRLQDDSTGHSLERASNG